MENPQVGHLVRFLRRNFKDDSGKCISQNDFYLRCQSMESESAEYEHRNSQPTSRKRPRRLFGASDLKEQRDQVSSWERNKVFPLKARLRIFEVLFDLPENALLRVSALGELPVFSGEHATYEEAKSVFLKFLQATPAHVRGSSGTRSDEGFAHRTPNSEGLRGGDEVFKPQIFGIEPRLLMASYVLVSLDQHEDGSWAKTLFKTTGGSFTSDMPNLAAGSGTQKKAITITSWAAQAVSKATNRTDLISLKAAKRFLLSHWNETASAFGNVYSQRSATPLISAENIFMANPRHTATAIKYLELVDGASPLLVNAIDFLLRTEAPRGGWGEAVQATPNTLSTAYVIDALTKISNTPHWGSFIGREQNKKVHSAVARGLAWISEQLDSDLGLWTYGTENNLGPFYSANVLAFAPTFATMFPDAFKQVIARLDEIELENGLPMSNGGQAAVAPTAMLIFALARIDPLVHAHRIKRLLSKLEAMFFDERQQINYGILDGIFSLALASLPVFDTGSFESDVKKLTEELDGISGSRNQKAYTLSITKKFDLPIDVALNEIFCCDP